MLLKALRSIKSAIHSLFFPSKRDTILRKPAGVRFRLESLEERLAPAIVSDGGTAILSIALGANENLAIVSNATSYALSSSQNFTAASGADPSNQATAFSGLGTALLTLTSAGIAQYNTGSTLPTWGRAPQLLSTTVAPMAMLTTSPSR